MLFIGKTSCRILVCRVHQFFESLALSLEV